MIRSWTQLQEENWKIYKHMKTKQHATKQPIGQRKNQREKSKDTLR